MIDLSSKSFWHKNFHWPLESIKISNLKENRHFITSRVKFYGVGSIPSSVIVKHYKDNHKQSSSSLYKKHKQENLFYQYLQQTSFYPSPRLYYAELDDAKRESILIIEDLHPRFKVFKANHEFNSIETNALIKSINLLTSHKLSRNIINKELYFLKRPIYTNITPVDTLISLKKAYEYGKLSFNDFNAVASNVIPLLSKIIKLLKSFPLTIALDKFSPTYFAMATNHSDSILINYRHLRIGNILDNVVAVFNKSTFNDDYVQYIFRYLNIINFKNKNRLSDIDLVKINTLAHKLSALIECEEFDKIELDSLSSLINYSYIVKSIFSY